MPRLASLASQASQVVNMNKLLHQVLEQLRSQMPILRLKLAASIDKVSCLISGLVADTSVLLHTLRYKRSYWFVVAQIRLERVRNAVASFYSTRLLKIQMMRKPLVRLGGIILILSIFNFEMASLTATAQGLSPGETVVKGSGPIFTNSVGNEAMTLSVGKSSVYKYRNPITRISVSNPAVADVMLTSPREVHFLGKKTGTTNVTLWYEDGRTTNLDIYVGGGDARFIKELFDELLPTEKSIKITAAGESLILSGKVTDAETVQKAVRITEEASGRKVLNMLATNDLDQVLLEVKIAEIDKTIADALGIQAQGNNFSFNMLGSAALGFSATAAANFGSGGGATSTWLQASMASGLVKILAEPNIMAISGQEGQFLSGGTVYLPVAQSGVSGAVITLQAVPYGIGVKFTPTVLADGKINLKVAPQVSQVSSTGLTVTAGGQTQVIPQILSRSASTTVQLYDGQSFAIGGLISNNVNEVISAFPWLATLPILGPLFRSSSFQNNRSELLIVVIPHIVRPLNTKPMLPTDSYIQPTQAEFFLGGKLQGDPPKMPATTTSMPMQTTTAPVAPLAVDSGVANTGNANGK